MNEMTNSTPRLYRVRSAFSDCTVPAFTLTKPKYPYPKPILFLQDMFTNVFLEYQRTGYTKEALIRRNPDSYGLFVERAQEVIEEEDGTMSRKVEMVGWFLWVEDDALFDAIGNSLKTVTLHCDDTCSLTSWVMTL